MFFLAPHVPIFYAKLHFIGEPKPFDGSKSGAMPCMERFSFPLCNNPPVKEIGMVYVAHLLDSPCTSLRAERRQHPGLAIKT